ncbi:ubiquitin carboxyl-terminal hydrolase MINDY-3 homolog [Cimex lectularius]|uniref:Ubiquitin carboxyl-terminal hydrolase MINDY n=1 Tax=Cimex lectularius TaxID=79782 RepID=A0A8I6R6D9_CIMLE|nr:ubiquitin carboxyl-terminal hydrolase MINDY-3 homolog [Cimex lectularius]
MAANSASPISPSDLDAIIKLMWGNEVKEDVFQRWKQGFRFSTDEPTALIQHEGGPCAVIAPVQAYIIKSLISDKKRKSPNWNEVESECVGKLLIRALCEILGQAYDGNRFVLVQMSDSILDEETTKTPPSPDAKKPKDHSYFHSQLRTLSFESPEEVEAYYLERIDMLGETFGVLLFLYSVLCTKGIEALHTEAIDPSETFIDSEFGYGSQSLINLMITGKAVAHVWNYDQDICGLKLKGIQQQSQIGFLTLLEHLRYCEVGSFLKNPMNPVWVLGSETHLTVLFSFESRLVCAETPTEVAKRVFKSFDPEGRNFISADLLQDVLNMLDLVSEPEYVDIMRKKLDAENLGIILLSSFMEEFFPEENVHLPDTFTLYHYNGLLRSCPNNKVVYQKGNAILLETHVLSVLENNGMLTCLQTKWPNIEVQWVGGSTPSLN